jgi:hypothetical protein
MQRKIKKFNSGETLQFTVIQRGKPGDDSNILIEMSQLTAEDLGKTETVVNKTKIEDVSGIGVIQKVQRISDKEEFRQAEMVEIDGKNSSFLISFSEDLIHCEVASVFDQGTNTIELNQLTKSEIVDSFTIGEHEETDEIDEC